MTVLRTKPATIQFLQRPAVDRRDERRVGVVDPTVAFRASDQQHGRILGVRVNPEKFMGDDVLTKTTDQIMQTATIAVCLNARALPAIR